MSLFIDGSAATSSTGSCASVCRPPKLIPLCFAHHVGTPICAKAAIEQCSTVSEAAVRRARRAR
jgi:hypothetical protein